MKSKVLSGLLATLLYKSPTVNLTKEEERLCHQLYKDTLNASHNQITYNLSIPKYKFLHYLLHQESILLHGSTRPNIQTFEPRNQTLFNGEMTKAIFATSDPIWPFFYAILNKNKIDGNIRNGSVSADGKQWFHYYSLTTRTLSNKPWTTGMIYILPKEYFTYVGNGTIHFNEWICKEAISPITKLEVDPADFYFMNKIATHQIDEKMLKTWIFYKMRTIFTSN